MRTKCAHCGIKGRIRRAQATAAVVGDPPQHPGSSSNGGGSSAAAIDGGVSPAVATPKLKLMDYATEGSVRSNGAATFPQKPQEMQELQRLELQAAKDDRRRIPHNCVAVAPCVSILAPRRQIGSSTLKLKKNVFKLIETVPLKFQSRDYLPDTQMDTEELVAQLAPPWPPSSRYHDETFPMDHEARKDAMTVDKLAGTVTLSLSDSSIAPQLVSFCYSSKNFPIDRAPDFSASADQLAGMAALSLADSSSGTASVEQTVGASASSLKYPIIVDPLAGMAALSLGGFPGDYGSSSRN